MDNKSKKDTGENKVKIYNNTHCNTNKPNKPNNTNSIVSNNSILEAYAKTKKRYKHTLEELAK